MTTNAQTNSCQEGSDVTFNPTRFAVVSVDHSSPAAIQYRFEIRRLSDSVVVQEYVFAKGTMTAESSNCYLSPTYTINPTIPRDNTTQYFVRAKLESSQASLTSEWSPNSVPFVLASKLRVGAVLVK